MIRYAWHLVCVSAYDELCVTFGMCKCVWRHVRDIWYVQVCLMRCAWHLVCPSAYDEMCVTFGKSIWFRNDLGPILDTIGKSPLDLGRIWVRFCTPSEKHHTIYEEFGFNFAHDRKKSMWFRKDSGQILHRIGKSPRDLGTNVWFSVTRHTINVIKPRVWRLR